MFLYNLSVHTDSCLYHCQLFLSLLSVLNAYAQYQIVVHEYNMHMMTCIGGSATKEKEKKESAVKSTETEYVAS